MGHNILVNKSPYVSREIKEAYRCLTRIMLNKKRSNSIAATEYDRLAEGEAPVPNSGKIDDLYKLVNTVGAKLGITATPLCLWYGDMLSP